MWYITYNTTLSLHEMAVPFEPTPEELEQFFGFVYVIVELDTGKQYLGKKLLWNSKILPITKTRKRRKKTLVESDWKEYYGSSNDVKSLVESKGKDNFKRVILRLCKSKGECSYYEAKYQFDNDVLLRGDFYNEFIGCRIHSKHLKDMK